MALGCLNTLTLCTVQVAMVILISCRHSKQLISNIMFLLVRCYSAAFCHITFSVLHPLTHCIISQSIKQTINQTVNQKWVNASATSIKLGLSGHTEANKRHEIMSYYLLKNRFRFRFRFARRLKIKKAKQTIVHCTTKQNKTRQERKCNARNRKKTVKCNGTSR